MTFLKSVNLASVHTMHLRWQSTPNGQRASDSKNIRTELKRWEEVPLQVGSCGGSHCAHVRLHHPVTEGTGPASGGSSSRSFSLAGESVSLAVCFGSRALRWASVISPGVPTCSWHTELPSAEPAPPTLKLFSDDNWKRKAGCWLQASPHNQPRILGMKRQSQRSPASTWALHILLIQYKKVGDAN